MLNWHKLQEEAKNSLSRITVNVKALLCLACKKIVTLMSTSQVKMPDLSELLVLLQNCLFLLCLFVKQKEEEL